MIHWTRQIKEVLSSQDNFEMSENSGPLEEIEFWKNRRTDLSGISNQLDKPGVKKISHILELAKSSYVGPFTKLAGQIKVVYHSVIYQSYCTSVVTGPIIDSDAVRLLKQANHRIRCCTSAKNRPIIDCVTICLLYISLLGRIKTSGEQSKVPHSPQGPMR